MSLKDVKTAFDLLPQLAQHTFRFAYAKSRKDEVSEDNAIELAIQEVGMAGYKWPTIPDKQNPDAYLA